MRRRKRSRSEMTAIDQINVTPLLDLTFLLLIAFMITMPLMEYGTAINPPEMNADKLPEDNVVAVTLTKTGTIMIDKEPVSREDLVGKLTVMRNANPKLTVLLRGDGKRLFEDVISLMAELRRSGFEDVTLVTQAERKQ